VDSRPGEGSRFTVRLPLQMVDAAAESIPVGVA
jgi:signal transduction histidine kinase